MPSVPPTFLLTGERGVGKTTTCLRLRARILGSGRTCAGVLTLPLVNRDGRRIGLDLFDVASGERRRLASCLETLRGPRVGPYSMAAATFAWGLSLVRRGLARADLIFVDEVGPLELDQGEGFAPLRKDFGQRVEAARLLVVRPSLIDRLMTDWGLLGAQRAEVTLANRSRLVVSLPSELLRSRPAPGSPFPPGMNLR